MRDGALDGVNVNTSSATHSHMLLRRQLLGGLLALAACRPDPKPVELPPVEELNSVGAGDTFTLEIIGEKDLPTEYEVAPDGTVALPFINRLNVDGLEPQQISEKVRQALMAGQFFRNPVVVVKIKAFKSKQITVAGEVKEPNSFAYRPGMTLSTAIALAGGMSTLARSWQVVLVRKTRDGSKKAIVDYDAINNNEIDDVPLQAGDKITVPQRAF